MADERPPDTDIATTRVRRAKLGSALQLPGLVIIGLALYYLGIRNIARGDDETVWTLVLVGYTIGSALSIWLMRKGIREGRN